MDREIPKEVRDKERKKKFIKYGAIGVAAVVCIAVLISFMRSSVNKKDLVFSEVDNGTIEVSVSASGKVVPAFEEIINSPINTRIVEVYRKGGDSVDVGTPILKLDLQSTETEYKKLLDEEQMKRYQLEQLKVNNNTYLSDLSMQVKISAMKLNRMEVELRNERYLDSLGSGTTDKVRQAELNFNTGKLELEQLRQQYANESKVKEADLKVKELEFNIFSKSLAEMKRTLDDAQIRSPRKAILTYINNQVGAQVAEGSQVAIISDLSHFKVEGEIADTYGDRVAAGGRAIVKIGNEKLEGTVSSVTPLSKNGVISFIVQLNEDNNKRLRSGLKTDVYVMNAVKEGYEVGASAPVEEMRSVDGTVKYLFRTPTRNFIEAVYIPDEDRATLCVSSQVGCKMNCKFCMTGKQGFTANLTANQILNQIYSIPEREKLTNLVFMGMGEPFDNLDEVLKVLEILTSEYGYGWSPKRITVSSVGLKKGLERFLNESDCHLAISMHTPIPSQRRDLMPAEKAFSITEIIDILHNYDFSKQRRLSFEYIVFKGVNDSLIYAKEIVKLLRGIECRVNLIRFHAIPDVDLEGVDMEAMTTFRDYLTQHGVFATIRASRGEDIFAACGMLSTAKQQKEKGVTLQ